MGVIWGSYGGHMRIILSLMEVLWCHMGIILEAYGGYLKNVPQTFFSFFSIASLRVKRALDAIVMTIMFLDVF